MLYLLEIGFEELPVTISLEDFLQSINKYTIKKFNNISLKVSYYKSFLTCSRVIVLFTLKYLDQYDVLKEEKNLKNDKKINNYFFSYNIKFTEIFVKIFLNKNKINTQFLFKKKKIFLIIKN